MNLSNLCEHCDLLLIAYLEPGLGYVPAGCANLADDIRWYYLLWYYSNAGKVDAKSAI